MKIIIFIIGFITNFMLLGLFLWLLKRGLPIAEIRTIMFVALGIDSVFYLFSCKNLHKNIWNINIFSNSFLIMGWFFAIGMLVVGVYVPAFQKLLRTVSLNFSDWILVLFIGLINLVLIEFTNWLFTIKRKT
jgi:Ca2+-transporting ATPase